MCIFEKKATATNNYLKTQGTTSLESTCIGSLQQLQTSVTLERKEIRRKAKVRLTDLLKI